MIRARGTRTAGATGVAATAGTGTGTATVVTADAGIKSAIWITSGVEPRRNRRATTAWEDAIAEAITARDPTIIAVAAVTTMAVGIIILSLSFCNDFLVPSVISQPYACMYPVDGRGFPPILAFHLHHLQFHSLSSFGKLLESIFIRFTVP